MKAVYVFLVCFICLHLFACDKNTTLESVNLSNETANTQKMKLKITIGTKEFTATLNNDETAKAFQTMLPLTITMSELNGNEKYFYFDTKLPTNASSGGNIQAGDLMLYGDNCLVVFYEGFNTSYSYTKLGRIDNPSGLLDALGSGNVTITFEAN